MLNQNVISTRLILKPLQIRKNHIEGHNFFEKNTIKKSCLFKVFFLLFGSNILSNQKPEPNEKPHPASSDRTEF
jgi:hypothetical protein